MGKMQFRGSGRMGSEMREAGSSFGRKASIVTAAVALGAGVLGAASDAQASFMLRLSSSAGGTPLVIVDNDGNDLDPDNDSIVASKIFPGYKVDINVGLTNTPGSPTGSTLQITNVARRDASIGSPTLTIQLAATNYND